MMNNPFGNFNAMMEQLQFFRQNPIQFMMRSRFNIPQNMLNSSYQEIQQYLLNTGQIKQSDMNWAQRTAKQLESNPMLQQFMNNQH